MRLLYSQGGLPIVKEVEFLHPMPINKRKLAFKQLTLSSRLHLITLVKLSVIGLRHWKYPTDASFDQYSTDEACK